MLDVLDSTPQSSQLIEKCKKFHREATPYIYKSVLLKNSKGYKLLDMRDVVDSGPMRTAKTLTILELSDCPLDIWCLRRFTSLRSCEVWLSIHDIITGDRPTEITYLRWMLGTIVKSSRNATLTAATKFHFCFGVKQGPDAVGGSQLKTQCVRLLLVRLACFHCYSLIVHYQVATLDFHQDIQMKSDGDFENIAIKACRQANGETE
jgi:hypothetical protein